jgi:SM-20-related protein
MGAARYRINPALDAEKLSRAFQARSRLHIPNFLHPEDAERLAAALEAERSWKLMMNQGDRLFELDGGVQAAVTHEKQAQVDAAVYAAATRGFQFRYCSIKAPLGEAERRAAPTPLNDFALFLSDEALDFLRIVTGSADIAFADAQATNYGPGHFLTLHDDDAADQDRRAAYVMNLTRDWRADWGGLLTFHGNGGNVVESFVPAFNALNLFGVPQPHSVGFVTPFAGARRYSVTGWLRAGAKP